MNKLKKMLALVLVAAVMILCLAGCAQKKAVTVTFTGMKSPQILTAAGDFVNLGMEFNVLKMTVKKDGVYPVRMLDDDGKDFIFMLTYDKGAISGEADEGIAFTLRVD